jgi:molecular chaperone HscB
MQPAVSGRRECRRCGRETAALLVCDHCAAVQEVPPDVDLFAVLGLPRRPRVDRADLEARYHAASRAVHPDRHQTAHPEERALSLAASAAVNRAYRTLRDPVARARYWLELHGEPLGARSPQVPPAIAAEVFEAQETLEALRAAPADAGLRGEVRARRRALDERLRALREDLETHDSGWSSLAELKRRLTEIAYLTTLFGDVDEALGEGLRGTHHRH